MSENVQITDEHKIKSAAVGFAAALFSPVIGADEATVKEKTASYMRGLEKLAARRAKIADLIRSHIKG